MTARRIRALLLATLLTGCGDGLGTESFDPMASSQKAQQAFGIVTSNPAVQDFAALSGAFTWTGAPPLLPSPLSPASASPMDILPATALGKTFTYNPQTGKYASSGQPGAPANGVRYLLYKVDNTTKAIVLPAESVGYLDLTNETTPSPNSLGIKAVVNNITVLDYKATGTASGASISLTAKGNVANATGQLAFDLSQNHVPTTGIKVDYKVTAPTPDVSIQVVLSAPPGSGVKSTVTLTVTEGRNKLEVNAIGNDAAVEGSVRYNKSTLAKISGSGANPVFTGQGGRQLSAQDLEGLKTLFAFVDELFDGIDNLLAPAYFVLGFTL
ncbi:MAG: hypothetical protein EXR93_02375 [Gemmatimonadetes bacterium]|nr:hypothetical protein [Gemmatimonadota bacterium]